MAPEILAPEPSNSKPLSEVNRKAADMWSFAVVLWEMVTREIPFNGTFTDYTQPTHLIFDTVRNMDNIFYSRKKCV